jgi:hypothetical protein
MLYNKPYEEPNTKLTCGLCDTGEEYDLGMLRSLSHERR